MPWEQAAVAVSKAGLRLITILFAQTRAQTQHELDAFDLVEHFAKHFPYRVLGWRGEHIGLVSQGFAGHGAVAAERAVTESRAGLEVLGHEPGQWDAKTSVHFVSNNELGVLISPGNEPDLNHARACASGRNARQRGALQGAVTAPRSGQAQDLHLARERPDELILLRRKLEPSIALAPLRLMTSLSARDELVKGVALVELALEDGG